MVFQTFNLFPHLSVRNNIVKTLKLVKKIDTSEAETITKISARFSRIIR